jgi:hypothetical protein
MLDSLLKLFSGKQSYEFIWTADLENWVAGQRFIIGVADQIPANGEIEKCRKISEIIREINK